MPVLAKHCCRGQDFRKHVYRNVRGFEFEMGFTKKLTDIHRKADSSLSTHSLALLTNAQERKTGHQLKFAIVSWQDFASLLYHDMALTCCNTVYHVLRQSEPR